MRGEAALLHDVGKLPHVARRLSFRSAPRDVEVHGIRLRDAAGRHRGMAEKAVCAISSGDDRRGPTSLRIIGRTDSRKFQYIARSVGKRTRPWRACNIQ